MADVVDLSKYKKESDVPTSTNPDPKEGNHTEERNGATSKPLLELIRDGDEITDLPGALQEAYALVGEALHHVESRFMILGALLAEAVFEPEPEDDVPGNTGT